MLPFHVILLDACPEDKATLESDLSAAAGE
jgi:hypothetical protein